MLRKKMGLNITGTEVASGVYDPSTMFVFVGIIILAGFILYGVYHIYSSK